MSEKINLHEVYPFNLQLIIVGLKKYCSGDYSPIRKLTVLERAVEIANEQVGTKLYGRAIIAGDLSWVSVVGSHLTFNFLPQT